MRSAVPMSAFLCAALIAAGAAVPVRAATGDAPNGEWQTVAPPPDSAAGAAGAAKGRPSSRAAAHPRGGWTWGWRGSAGATTFSRALSDSTDGSFASFDIGAFASRKIGWLALEPQAIVAVRGGSFTDPVFGTVYDPVGGSFIAKVGEFQGTLSLVELRSPLIARLQVLPVFFEPHVFAGVVPSLLVYGSYSGNRILRDFESDAFRRANLGWTAGAGTRWPTHYGVLTVELRYEESGHDVFKYHRGMPGREGAWMLGFGLQMGHGGRRERGGEGRRRARPR